MKIARTLMLLPILAGLLCFHTSTAWSGAKSIGQIIDLLEEEKKDLAQLKAKIEKQNKKISSAGKKETSLLRTLGRLEDRLRLKERELGIYKWNIAINIKKVAKLTRNMKATKKSLAGKKSILVKRLRAIYKEGGLYPIKILFSSDDVADMVQRLKYMELAAAYDSALFQKYAKKLQKLNREKEALLQVRSDLMQLRKEVEGKKKEITPEKTRKLKFLQKIKREKKLGVKVQRELIQASLDLNKIISRQEEKLRQGENLNFTDYKGRLALPVKGKILNRFGKKRDKQYDSYIVYNGINIRASKGTPVRAVYSGKVLHVGSLPGYGDLIIIGHGENYHSIYAHLEQIVTTVGEKVRKGQVIGKSGDSGSMVGEALYFEMRHKGEAIEPTAWFRLRKK